MKQVTYPLYPYPKRSTNVVATNYSKYTLAQSLIIKYLIFFFVLSLVGCGGESDYNKPVYIDDFYVEVPYQTQINYHGTIKNNSLKTVTIGYSVSNNLSGINYPTFASYGIMLSPGETLQEQLFSEGDNFRAGSYEATLTLFDISGSEEIQIDKKTINFTIPNTADEPIYIQKFDYEITSSSILLEGLLSNDSLQSHVVDWEFLIYNNGNVIGGLGATGYLLEQGVNTISYESWHSPSVPTGNYEAVLNLMAPDPDHTLIDTETIFFTVQ